MVWKRKNSTCECVKPNDNFNTLFLRSIVHCCLAIHHVFSSVYIMYIFYQLRDVTDPVLADMRDFGVAFFTNWNLLFQTVFLFLSLCYDIQEWRSNEGKPLGQKIKYYRDIVFCGLVTPFTLFVSSFFWVIYWIDRELVFPVVYDTVVPFWFNHCVHTNVTVVILLETLLQARRHPTNEKLETGCVAAIGLSYAIVYYSIHFFAHRWLYEVFGVMTWWQVCLFQLMIWASNYFYYRIQFPINRLFHKEEAENEEKQDTDSNGIVKEEFSEEKKNVENDNSYSENSLYLKCRPVKEQCEKTKF